MIYQDSLCYREIEPDGLFFSKKVEFFDMMDKMLDDDGFRREREIISLSRARELSNNESTMLLDLHKKMNNIK
jgi:hypothetical protein